MTLDRIFGMIAAATFALGIVGQMELLSSATTQDPFQLPLLAFFASALIAIGYLTLRADRNQGLIDPYDESVDLVEVAFSLPPWAIAISVILAGYVVLVYLAVRVVPDLVAQLPAQFSVLQQSLSTNGLVAFLLAMFTFTSFVIGAYLLIRAPVKNHQ